MTDLTEYDREIVVVAEELAECIPLQPRILSALETRLCRAVQAKRDAQRPRCTWGKCGKPATQQFIEQIGVQQFFRCDEHRIEVREL